MVFRKKNEHEASSIINHTFCLFVVLFSLLTIYIQFKAKKGLNDKKIFLLYFMSPRSFLDFLVMSVFLRYNDYN